MVPCDGLASYPGCTSTLRPVFLGWVQIQCNRDKNCHLIIQLLGLLVLNLSHYFIVFPFATQISLFALAFKQLVLLQVFLCFSALE